MPTPDPDDQLGAVLLSQMLSNIQRQLDEHAEQIAGLGMLLHELQLEAAQMAAGPATKN